MSSFSTNQNADIRITSLLGRLVFKSGRKDHKYVRSIEAHNRSCDRKYRFVAPVVVLENSEKPRITEAKISIDAHCGPCLEASAKIK